MSKIIKRWFEECTGWGRVNEMVDICKPCDGKGYTVDDGWISVEDKQPEENRWCIVYSDIQGFSFCFLSVNKHRKQFIDSYGDKFLATHWQPLPEPPKESKK